MKKTECYGSRSRIIMERGENTIIGFDNVWITQCYGRTITFRHFRHLFIPTYWQHEAYDYFRLPSFAVKRLVVDQPTGGPTSGRVQTVRWFRRVIERRCADIMGLGTRGLRFASEHATQTSKRTKPPFFRFCIFKKTEFFSVYIVCFHVKMTNV